MDNFDQIESRIRQTLDHPRPLRVLKCALCGLRMHGKFRCGRNVAYYTCEINRRYSGLVPEDHPRMVYLREDKAGEKVVEFLATHLFGPDRIEALKQSLAEADRRRIALRLRRSV